MMQLNAIQLAVNKARVTRGNAEFQEPALRARGRELLKRLFIPDQVLRFPTQESWEEFRSAIPEDAYEIIDHTDPLGFDGGAGVVIVPGANPRNYLRRNQLPNKTIDMTNIYKPEVLGSVPNDNLRKSFIPFLGYRNGQYYPSILDESWDSYNQNIVVRPLSTETVVSVLQPKLFTYKEALDYLFQNWSNNFGFLTSLTRSVVNTRCFLFPPPTPNTNVPQSEDCSEPTVGCFWFNDGRSGQLELPKDPACRACVIIRFKKYALV